TLAANEHAAAQERVLAAEVLGYFKPRGGEILVGLLDARHPQALQSAAAAALGRADAATAEKMFAHWSTLTPDTRRALLWAALRSVGGTTALVTAIDDERIDPRELEPAVRDALLAVRDPGTQARVKELFKEVLPSAGRQEVVARFEKSLALEGDAKRGA